MLDAALGGQSVEGVELTMNGADDLRVEILFNATARQDASGRVLGVMCVGQDVTQVRRQAAPFHGLPWPPITSHDLPSPPMISPHLP